MRKLTEIDIKHLIDYQMELNGYKERFDDLLNHPDWFRKFTTTEEMENKFRTYLIEFLKPFVGKRARKEAGRFILNYGLRTIKSDT